MDNFIEFIKNSGNRWKDRYYRAKDWTSDKFVKVKIWAENNPELALATFTVLTGTAIKCAKGIASYYRSTSRIQKMKDLRSYYIYDHSTGHYWKTKYELDNQILGEIQRRKNNGEKLFDILLNMGVLA